MHYNEFKNLAVVLFYKLLNGFMKPQEYFQIKILCVDSKSFQENEKYFTFLQHHQHSIPNITRPHPTTNM